MPRHPTPVSKPLYSPSQPPLRQEQLAVEWITWLRDVKGRAQNTLSSYSFVMEAWLDWCAMQDVEVLQPTLTELEAFMTRKRKNGRQGSPSSRRSDAAVLRGWYKWMHERNMIPENPALDLSGPTTPRGTGRPIEDAHWVTIWNSDLPPRLRTVLGLGFYCGLRREEIGTLQTDQLTPTRIVRFTRKGGGEDTLSWMDMAEVHHVRLPHLLPDMSVFTSAVEHVRYNYEKVIPWALPRELYRRMSKLCTSLDVPQYTPHQLRHSTATNLLRAGVAPHIVMRLMNHSSFDITMGYVRAGGNDLKDWLHNVKE